MNIKNTAHIKYSESNGRINIKSKMDINKIDDISKIYVPECLKECLKVKEDKSKLYDYTNKNNMVLVVTNGSDIAELGNIGAEASLPFLESKCSLLKSLANIDAIPICLKTNNLDEIVNCIFFMSSTFGAILLEGFCFPLCFEIEKRLEKICNIPIFNDDKGTAVILAAALINSSKLLNKDMSTMKIVINDISAPGIFTANYLVNIGFLNITIVDRLGFLNSEILNKKITISKNITESIIGADVYISFSEDEYIDSDAIKNMDKESIIFMLSSLTSRTYLDKYIKNNATILGTGKIEFSNFINNIFSTPGILRGALDGKILKLNDEILLNASFAISELILPFELNHQHILPDILDQRLSKEVSESIINSIR